MLNKVRFYCNRFYENRNFRRIYSVVYHPQTKHEIISGGWDGKLQFYDLRVANVIDRRTHHGMTIIGEGIDFHPSGTEFCTVSWSKKDTMQLWDYSMKQSIKVMDNYRFAGTANGEDAYVNLPSSMLYSCRYYLNGNFLTVGGSNENSLVVMDRNSSKIIAAIKGLKSSVYCVDTSGSKITFISGKDVAVTDVFVSH